MTGRLFVSVRLASWRTEEAMYLLLYLDGSAVVVRHNLFPTDILAIAQGLVKIFRKSHEGFEQVCKDEKTYIWVDVKEAKTVVLPDGVIHL